MAKFYKKQTPVEAYQVEVQTTIKTQSGHLNARPGMWVINDNTHMSVMEDSNFRAMYYPVPEPAPAPVAPVVTASLPVAPEPVVTVTPTPEPSPVTEAVTAAATEAVTEPVAAPRKRLGRS